MRAGQSQWVWGAMLAAAVLTLESAPVEAASPGVRTVRGEVVAVNLQASPQVIVIKAAKSGKDDLIVGATVGSETKVTRGSQAISLGALKLGETVSLTYTKHEDGLAAQSIQAP